MIKEESSLSDLLIEPLMLKHLSILKLNYNPKYIGIFQILLYKKWFSSLESKLTNIIPTRSPTCYVAIEENKVIAYILATPINKRGSCWSISEPNFIRESTSHSRYNLLQGLLKKVLYSINIKTQSFLISINTNDNQNLSIVRQSGFQPLRIIKYWKQDHYFGTQENEDKNDYSWERLNKVNSQQIWRLEKAKEPINFRAIFDRQWLDIYEKRNIFTGVIKVKDNNIIAGLIPSICPQNNLSLELIRGLAWDERLNLFIPQRINNIKLGKKKFFIETTSGDNKLNELLKKSGWEVQEERVLLGRSIWKRQDENKVNSIKTELLTNIVGNLQQQPELPSTFQIEKI